MTSKPKRFLKNKILRPFEEFLRVEAFRGVPLLAATLIALIWANSPWEDSGFHIAAAERKSVLEAAKTIW